MQPETRRSRIAREFVEIYGRSPSIWSRAPGRVDLMGSHTDYNLGFVMTMTVDRDIWIAAAPRADRRVRVASLNVEGRSEFALDEIRRDPVWPWTNYIRGVAAELGAAGKPLCGFDGLIHSTVPTGSGLSSSAALELAAAVTFQALGGFAIDRKELALLCQRAENRFVGVNCGILDQYSSALGQAGSALLLDCRDLSAQLRPVAGSLSVVICDTRAERNLAGTEYAERRAQCEAGVTMLQSIYPHIRSLRDVTLLEFEAQAHLLPAVVARRCRFILEENQRVLALADRCRRASRIGCSACFRPPISRTRLVRDWGSCHAGYVRSRRTGARRHRSAPGRRGLRRLYGCVGRLRRRRIVRRRRAPRLLLPQRNRSPSVCRRAGSGRRGRIVLMCFAVRACKCVLCMFHPNPQQASQHHEQQCTSNHRRRARDRRYIAADFRRVCRTHGPLHLRRHL